MLNRDVPTLRCRITMESKYACRWDKNLKINKHLGVFMYCYVVPNKGLVGKILKKCAARLFDTLEYSVAGITLIFYI